MNTTAATEPVDPSGGAPRATGPSPEPTSKTPRPRGRFRALRSPLAGLGAGALICTGLPPWGWWPVTLVGLGWWLALLGDRGRRGRFAVGALVSLAWFTPSLLWMWKFSIPGYAAVLIVFALGFGLMSMLVGDRPTRFLLFPALLVPAEWLRWHAPFGGAPVSVLPMTQVGGPLLPVARVGGPLLVTLIAAAIPAALIAATTRPATPRMRHGAAAAAAGIGLITLLATFAPRGESVGELRVAAVQGGGPQATRFARGQAEPVFRRHLEATEAVPEGLDLIVWPENVVNVTGNFEAHPWREELAGMAERKGAPILFGSVEDVLVPEVNPDGFYNFSQVLHPDGTLGDRYDKQRRVPFGEYVPLRSLFEPLAGGALPRRDQVPGPGPNVVRSGGTTYALMISWEVFFHRIARQGVRAGGEVLLNPTNGSSYWLTMVQTQQIASSRLRAVETGRDLVQAAPTGFTAFVNPAGDVVQRTSVGEQRVLVGSVNRRHGDTIATLTGDWLALGPAGALIAVALLLDRRRRRRHAPSPEA